MYGEGNERQLCFRRLAHNVTSSSDLTVSAKDITIHMALSVSDIFTADLKNITSDKYKSLEKKFEHYVSRYHTLISSVVCKMYKSLRIGFNASSQTIDLGQLQQSVQADPG